MGEVKTTLLVLVAYYAVWGFVIRAAVASDDYTLRRFAMEYVGIIIFIVIVLALIKWGN